MLLKIILHLAYLIGCLAFSLEIGFKVESKSIPNEFIVLFKSYYLKHTREKYIKSYINLKTNITQWNFGERSQQANHYPSDFEVVTIHCDELCGAKSFPKVLEIHPAIKRVVLQTSIQRKLKFNDGAVAKNSTGSQRKLLGAIIPSNQITDLLGVQALWERGITGKGVKVAVFDTGLPEKHPHFRNVKERTNWTNEKSLDDGVSHGTFVCGIIASSKECLGIAPDVELHIFRVFTNIQVSYTSWFLDAFNYAIFRKINVLNLSIGGPDFMDQPFVDKVLELSANRIIMVSAIGNDGPLFGTLNNPGDQSDVIGVGGINSDELVAKFSSRGMTSWELPRGYGRVKPDIVTYGSHVKGSDLNGGCRSLSGTSVASPVVAGAIALILSGAPEKLKLMNQAAVKQILAEGATKLPHNNIFEQGYGKLNVQNSMQLLLAYSPKITLSPPYMDYADPYMWPYSSQPLYCKGMPSIINVTIWNGVSVRGKIKDVKWHPDLDTAGDLLNIDVQHSDILWPWSGWMAVLITVKEHACSFEGESKGYIRLAIETTESGNRKQEHNINFPLNVKIVPTPPRGKRLLWDQYHNLQYPPGFLPKDNLKIKSDPLDWRDDHIHTNFRDMYHHLRNLGYYIDVLGAPFTCFNASDYGTLLIVDPEEEFFDEEIHKLQSDVFDHGLGVIVFADWYNTTVMRKMKFFDENTREWWMPDTGGANVPALNDLLNGFGIALSDVIVEGNFRLAQHNVHYESGITLDTFPKHNANNVIISAHLNDQGAEIIRGKENKEKQRDRDAAIQNLYPIIGLFQMENQQRIQIDIPKEFVTLNEEVAGGGGDLNAINTNELEHNPILNKRVLLQIHESKIAHNNVEAKTKQNLDFTNDLPYEGKEGRIVVMGDSNCIDSTHSEKHCLWLLNAFLEYTMNSHIASVLKEQNTLALYSHVRAASVHPKRLKTSKLHNFSKVVHYEGGLKKRHLEKCYQNISS